MNDSGWIINFNNGKRVIMSERTYENTVKKYSQEKLEKEVYSLEHWFDIEDAKSKNPNLEIIE